MTVGVLGVGLVVAGVLYDGVATADVDLNDGGVWVTSQEHMRLGRLNSQVQLLDGGLAARSGSFDVLQDGSHVFLVDEGAGLLQQVDPATVTTTTTVSLPGPRQIQLGGGTVAVLDSRSGQLHATDTGRVGTLADEELEASARLGANGVIAVGVDGTTYGVSPSDATLLALPAGFDAETDEAPEPAGLGVEPERLAEAEIQVSAVGQEAVVLVRDEQDRVSLLRPGSEPVDLTDLADTAQVALQAPSGAGREVLVAARDGMIRVPLGSGEPTVDPVSQAGTPSRPVVVAGCGHGAWAGGTGVYQARCGNGEVVEEPIDKSLTDARLVFRVNRDVVVLNDLVAGTVWLVKDAMEIVENWDDVVPPQAASDDEEESQQQIEEQLPLDREQENRDPIAQDDDLGVRAGSTTVLEVLANDTDPDGDLLTVASFDTPAESFGTVRPIMGGRALQVAVAEGASGAVAMSYTVSDGRGGEAEAVARVSVVPEDVNRPPEQVRPATLTLVTGATGSVNVLDTVRDPDGDEVVVVAATASTDDIVRFTPDGAVTFVDSGVTPGMKPVAVEVYDGTDTAEVELSVDVRPAGALPPVPVFDFVTAIAGEETVVEPLVNDTDPGGEAEPLRLADVQQVPGASVVPDYDTGTFRFSADAAQTYYLTYIVVNDAGASATGLIRVDVREPAEAAPVAVQDVGLLPAGGQVLVDVLANDEDPSGQLLAVRQVDVPEGSGLSVAVLEHRILKITASQDVQATQRLTYEVSNGETSATGEVVVMQVPPDALVQPPVAQADVANVRAGDFVTIPVLSNDSHPAGLEFELATELVEEPQAGHLFASGDTLRFRAPEQPQTINAVYEVVDESDQRASAQVTIYVQADDGERNAPPQPLPVESRAFAGERIRIQVPLFGIDPDGDSVQLLGADQAPTKGRIVEVGPTYIDYEAFSRASGTDTFTYAVRDRLGTYASATAKVAVIAPPDLNRAPQAIDDEVLARPGRVVDVDPVANDTDPDGDPLYLADPAFDAVEQLGVEQLDSGRLRITTPEAEGTFALPYHVTDQRGGRSTGIVTVEVSAEAPLQAPVAVDDLVRAITILGQERVTIPVLDNDVDPDGTREDLTVGLVGSPENARVVGDEVQVDVMASRQVLTYSVTDIDGLTSYAFVDVPGLEDSGPVLRTDVDPIVVATGETRQIELADYVVAPSGKEVRLTSTDKVRATNSDGSSPVVGPTTLTFTSAPTYAGPATLTFEVTDGQSAEDPEGLTAVLTLDITVESTENTPPTFDGAAVEVVPAEAPVVLNLRQLAQDPDTGDFNQLRYELVGVPDGIEASLDGPNLTVSAPVDTPQGTVGTIDITVSDAKAEPVPGVVEVTVTASNRRLASVNDVDLGELEQGESRTVDVLQGAFNPFPDQSLTVIDALTETGGAAASFDAGSVTVTAGADFVGRGVSRFIVQDATGDPNRQVEGRISYSVIGVPERPTPPRVQEVRDQTVVLTWSAPADNGAPITGYRVEAAGVSQQCPTTTCTIGGLTNDVEYTFTVTATNKVGDSEPSGPSAVARPDVKPERPAPPTLVFGDGQLEVRWETPVSRGSSVSSYDLQIAPSPGGGQVSVSGNSHTWTGLRNGQSYTVRVRAHNDAPDPSEWSEWSAPEVPAGVPDQPVAPTAQRVDSPVNAQISASWTAPPNNGDAIASFDVVIRRDGAAFKSFTVPGGQTSFTEDAPAGSDYTVSVAATNKAGTSPASPQSAPVRSFLQPDRVPSVTAEATGQDGIVQLAHATPADNGDAIRRFEVSVNGGGWSQLAGDKRVTGLSDGASYTFSVRACNTYCGEASPASAAAVPFGPFGQATASGQAHGRHNGYTDGVSEQPGATFAWTTPDGNGRAVTSVQLRLDNGNGSWGAWQQVAANGNRRIDGDWGRTYRAEVRVERADGEVRTASASARTVAAPVPRPPDPPQPSVTMRRGDSAVGMPGCTFHTCAYLAFDYANMPSGRYTVEFSAPGERNPWKSYTVQLAGDGRWQATSYRGGSGETVTVRVRGNGVDLSSSHTWPR
ncbi:tandem-95 repeat protein [Georgenia wutianyii]|uniref:Tandem-95 repeat protein n=1 Tax=Georgenia wutianyii TaxID=2585135 RepID=A0ABX5VNH7_9MICO|nr:fibronectin type III domain-containing protein [Georgenia wutianyii]QDB78908.1 tandem-95 repeat protein [Georgenia wutianyii]